MYVTAYFSHEGIPQTGLEPTVRIRDLADDSLVVTDETMLEVGDGWYKYDFTSFDDTKDYVIRCDGGDTLEDAERYVFGGNEEYSLDEVIEKLDDILDGDAKGQIIPGNGA